MSDDRDEGKLFVTGQLAEPFEALDEPRPVDDFDVSEISPGDPYPGPTDDTGGTVNLRRKRGGVVERPAASVCHPPRVAVERSGPDQD